VSSLLVRHPFTQTILAKIATTYLTKKLQTRVNIDRLEITSFKSLSMKNFLVHDQRNDTLLFTGKFSVNLKDYSLKNSNFNIAKINLEHADIRVRKYKETNELNMKFIIDFFRKDTSDVSRAPMLDTLINRQKDLQLSLKGLTISNSIFIFENQTKERKHAWIDFRDIEVHINHLDVSNAIIENDTLMVDINQISFFEKSGFQVDSLSCQFKISTNILQAQKLLLRTPVNDIDLDLTFSYDSFKDYKDFIHNIHIQSTIRPSTINLVDVGYFAPVMFKMDNRIKLSGNIKGTVDNFKAKDFKFAYGGTTQFRGNIQMNGLPDIKETYSHLSIKDFFTTIEDVRRLNLPIKNSYVDLPEILTNLGKIKVHGKFTGFYNDFVSYGSFLTEIGQVHTDILLVVNSEDDIEYKGKIAANDFNLGQFLNIQNYVNKLDLNAEIIGSGVKFENMNISLNGIIDSLEFFNNIYNEIIISGDLVDQKFEGNVNVTDELGNLDFNGIIDYSQNIPRYNFIAALKDAQLQKINLANRDPSMSLSTNLNINLIGDQIDNMQGIIMIDSTKYSELGETYVMNDFTLSITRDESRYSLIRLYSDFIDASVEGNFYLRELPKQFYKIGNQYLDTLFSYSYSTDTTLNNQDFVFDIQLKNTNPITQLFLPELQVANETQLIGGFNSIISNFFLDVFSKEIIYNGKKIKNLSLETYTHEDEFYVSTHAEKVLLSDSVFMDSLVTTFRARNDSIIYSINWQNDNKDVRNYGDFEGYLSIYSPQRMELKFDHGTLAINDTLWWINESNLLRIDSSEFDFHEVTLYNESQAINVNGKITKNITDTLHIGFSNFDLAGLRPILRRIKIDADGQINGEIKVIDYYNSPSYLSDLTISDFYFNEEKLGEATLKINWDPANDAFDILGEIIYTGNIGKSKTLEVKGTYYPNRSDDNYDIRFKLNNYKLNTLQPFLKSFSSQLEGMANGEAMLTGSKEKPKLLGEINLLRTQLKIDYLNVSYYLADKVYLDDNVIYFNDITVYDTLNNTAKASGKIYHDNLRDFRLDLEFDVNNLVGLHTTRAQNEMFYGSALATGRVNLYGPLNNLNLDIIARTEKGTNVKIPVSYGTEVTENDYIVFVNNNTDTMITKSDYNVELNGISLNLDLKITHDADIQMFLPYNMGNIKGNGRGDIKMAIDPGGDFTMEGDYIINRGSFFLTLQNILNRNFEIRRGSKIMWTGDPYNAQINLKAVYKVKTKLGQFAPEQDSATRVPVDCIIALSNRLLNPEIKFTVEFPDLKDDTKQFIYARLDTNDQAMMSQQMISLLVLNSFTDPSVASGSVGFNTFSLLTNQLNNWLSQISNDFDIGINYRPGNELTAQEVEVALSTQLFDDRVSVDGNVGMRGSEDTQKTNDLVGEVTVEVKITKDGRFRAKAFNKSNNNYLYKSYAPYTQGVGVFYTQEFNRLRDLFKKKNKKDKQKKDEKPEEQSMLHQ
jgi:hypothetical protein